MRCGDPNRVSRYVNDELTAAERAEVEAHLDDCAECRMLVAELARTLADSSETEVQSSDKPVRVGDSIGRYVIREWIGEGAMGVVYRAEDPQLQRDVALKLVRTGDADLATRTARLLREATLMARIAHPNVVPVYDAGAHAGRVYLAQELVVGTNLERWQHDNRAGPRPLLERWLEAGRGLAAAHAAGVLHRDFKPANVLVGADGRARVTDFGLARRGAELAVETSSAASGDPSTSGLLGTPRYMAPEQRRGIATAASDQYSYAVGLREALATEAPSVVTRALVRATRDDPAQRFESMAELLDQLELALRPKRRVAAYLTLALGCALVLGLGAWRLHALRTRASCESFASELAGLTGKDSAGALVTRAIDAWSSQWIGEKRASCLATRVAGSQSEELFELRTECLEQQRREVSTLLSLLVKPGEVSDPRAAVQELPSPATCANARDLLDRAPLPADPGQRARLASVRKLLDEAIANRLAGHFSAALELVGKARAELTPLGYAPMESDLERIEGGLHSRLGHSAAAEAAFRRAALAGIAGRHDTAVVRAYVGLIYHVGHELRRFDDAHRLAEEAEAALARYGTHDELRARLDRSLCVVLTSEGRPAEAVPYGERAVRLLEKTYGTDSFETTMARQYEAYALSALGRLEDAARLNESAIASLESTLGDPHSQLCGAIDELGTIRFEQGRLDEALALHRRALQMVEHLANHQHYKVFLLPNAARDLAALGQRDEALELLARAEPIADASLGKDHLDTTKIQVLRARIALRTQPIRYQPGMLEALERAVQVGTTAHAGPRDRAAAGFWLAHALVLADPSNCRRARGLADEAYSLLEGAPGVATRDGETTQEIDTWRKHLPCRANTLAAVKPVSK